MTVLRHILRKKTYLDMYLERRTTLTYPFVKNNMQSFAGNRWNKMAHIGKGKSDVTHEPSQCLLSAASVEAVGVEVIGQPCTLILTFYLT